MSARKISRGEFLRLSRLLRIAQEEKRGRYRTEALMREMLSGVPNAASHVCVAVEHDDSARALLASMNLKVKGKK